VSLKMVLIAILGFSVGIIFKTQALQSITIGFDDKNVVGARQDYNIASIEAQQRTLQKEKIKQQEEQIKKMEEEQNKQKEESEKEAH